MQYEDMIGELYDSSYEELIDYYESLSPAQQNVVSEIVARKELAEEEFENVITNPVYYK